MKRARIAVTVLVALTLTGCAGTPDNGGDERTAPTVTETAEPSAAPLTAETPEVDVTPNAETAYLAAVRDALPVNTSIPNASDGQLVEAGWEACEQIRSGTDPGDVRLVDGEQSNGADIYADSSAIMNAALLTLCPELI